jgi:hypothetical protein
VRASTNSLAVAGLIRMGFLQPLLMQTGSMKGGGLGARDDAVSLEVLSDGASGQFPCFILFMRHV